MNDNKFYISLSGFARSTSISRIRLNFPNVPFKKQNKTRTSSRRNILFINPRPRGYLKYQDQRSGHPEFPNVRRSGLSESRKYGEKFQDKIPHRRKHVRSSEMAPFVPCTYLHSYSQIVLLYALVIQGMVNLDVGPGDGLLVTLLKVKRVKLVRLRRGPGH